MPQARDDLEAFVAHVADPRRWTWVLDFDGTLSELVEHPAAATPVDGGRDAVRSLAEVAEVAVLSGRSVEDLVARLGGPLPDVLLVGGHGSDAMWPDGHHEPLAALPDVAGVLADVTATLESRLDPADGWLVEPKRASVAVHHRRVDPERVEAMLPWVHAVLAAAASTPPGFEVLDGKKVVELRPAGVDKGRAVDWLVERSMGHPPVVIGDDVTDEEAFVAAIARDGTAARVTDDLAPTAARFRLASPSRVVASLRQVRHAVGEDAPRRRDAPWAGRR